MSKLILIITVILFSLNSTIAYFHFSNTISNKFTAKNYNIKLNANGGTYNVSSIKVKNGKTTLPTPSKNGYTFSGYSSSENGNVDISTNVTNINDINNKVIYAKYEINHYTISYNTNGGSISNQKTSYTIEEDYTLPIPIKEGNSFSGWTGSNGNTPQKSVTIAKGSTGNKSYTANWNIKSYTTTLKANKGGSINEESESIEYGGTKNVTITPNTGYYLSEFSCTNGYTTNAKVGSSQTSAQTITISNNSKDKTATCTASFTPISYTISYDTNGGSISNQKTSYTVEEDYTLPTPTKEGNSFSGWTGSNGNTPQKSVTIAKGSTGNKSYTANWEVNSYTTTLKANKGGSINKDSESINYGGTKNVTVTPNTGYYLSEFSCTNGYTSNAKVGSSQTSAQTITISNNSKDKTATCTASFTPVTYTITYNVNGGNELSSRTYTVETPTFTLPTPTRRVHNFIGWTGSNGNTPQKSVTITQGSTGNKSFTANWSKIDAAITGVTVVSLRKGETWNGNADGYYSFGTSNQNAGNWTVSVSNHSVHIKGTTKVISEDRYYTFYIYAGNGTSGELLASGTDYPVANRGSGTYAEITLSW